MYIWPHFIGLYVFKNIHKLTSRWHVFLYSSFVLPCLFNCLCLQAKLQMILFFLSFLPFKIAAFSTSNQLFFYKMIIIKNYKRNYKYAYWWVYVYLSWYLIFLYCCFTSLFPEYFDIDRNRFFIYRNVISYRCKNRFMILFFCSLSLNALLGYHACRKFLNLFVSRHYGIFCSCRGWFMNYCQRFYNRCCA